MPRQKYKLNPESLNFELIKIPLRHKTQRFMVLFFVSLALFFIYANVYAHFFENPKIMLLKNKNTNVQLKYNLLLKDIENAAKVITEINSRDQNLYRTIFGLDEISYTQERRNGNVQKSDLLSSFNLTFLSLDNFRHKVYIQSKSFDEIAFYAASVEKMAATMPAIAPLDIEKTRTGDISSKFGMRPDPFTGEPRMHHGIDLSVDIGTPVYATGDGKVLRAYSGSGYGQTIDIDHGFGYLTRYAHLSEILVSEGQQVKRGQRIALSGNSGTRTVGPHLHYEVHHRSEPQNPMKFFVLSQSDVNYAEFISKINK